MNSTNETKVIKTIDLTPTWLGLWNLWLRIGKIDKDTYDLFLPAMIALDKQNDEITEDNQS